MDKFQFIQYSAKRYGIDDSVAETMVDMFTDCLQELVAAGHSIEIDGLGEFKTTPLFPEALKHHNNTALAKLAKHNMISFTASKQLTKSVA